MAGALGRLLSAFAVVGLLSTAVPAVRADDELPGEAAEEELEGEHGGHHSGPLHLSDVIHNPEFWTAVVNFTLLVYLLVRFGRAPIRDFLGNRRKEMEKAINEAAEAKTAAEAKLKEYQDRLAQLDQELAKLRADLIAAGEEDRRRIAAEGEETARRMKMETDALIDQHAKALAAQVRRDVVDAAVAAAERMLREQVTVEDQQRLAEGFRRELASGAAKATPGSPGAGRVS